CFCTFIEQFARNEVGIVHYELFQDSGRSTIWTNTGAGLLSIVAAPSKASRTYSVYARMAGGQDVPAGTYTDTVVATVNF
ncbi:MAG: spore coat protein U domain-containing protein, partial [Acidobacteriota bacterium]